MQVTYRDIGNVVILHIPKILLNAVGIHKHKKVSMFHNAVEKYGKSILLLKKCTDILCENSYTLQETDDPKYYKLKIPLFIVPFVNIFNFDNGTLEAKRSKTQIHLQER